MKCNSVNHNELPICHAMGHPQGQIKGFYNYVSMCAFGVVMAKGPRASDQMVLLPVIFILQWCGPFAIHPHGSIHSIILWWLYPLEVAWVQHNPIKKGLQA